MTRIVEVKSSQFVALKVGFIKELDIIFDDLLEVGLFQAIIKACVRTIDPDAIFSATLVSFFRVLEFDILPPWKNISENSIKLIPLVLVFLLIRFFKFLYLELHVFFDVID